MSEWNHSICVVCWNTRNPDRQTMMHADGPYEVCCFCGKYHASGIYVRMDPAEMKCRHNPKTMS